MGALDGLSQIEAKSQAKIHPGWPQAWSKEPLLRLAQPLPQQQRPQEILRELIIRTGIVLRSEDITFVTSNV